MRILMDLGSNWLAPFDYSEALDPEKLISALKDAWDFYLKVFAKDVTFCLKLQVFSADGLYSQQRAPFLYARAKTLEFPRDWIEGLSQSLPKEWELWATPFDERALDFAPYFRGIKIASGDLTYERLLRQAAGKAKDLGLPIVLSTGAAYVTELLKALKTIQKIDREGKIPWIGILSCVSLYPAQTDQYAFRPHPWIGGETWPWPIHLGVSDHTMTFEIAAWIGAFQLELVEHHFVPCIPRQTHLPDLSVSYTPQKFSEYVRQILQAMEMGKRTFPKGPCSPEEERERIWARRGKDQLRPKEDAD